MPQLIRYRGVIYKRVASGTLLARISTLRMQLAAAAQRVVDAWEQDEEGIDCELGSGGACDQVAQELAGVLADAGIDSVDGGQPGDDHAWLIAYDENTDECVGVDIPPDVYETGGGYSWTKRADAQITAEDVLLWPIKDISVEDLLDSAY